jgi:predicted molibdopterin-dependent oxidoreductase YjgC
MDSMNPTERRFVRLGETGRRQIRVWIDGRPTTALEGDTLLVALLSNTAHLRHSEFSDGVRSGFCLMGACQDCWVRDEQGQRIRACSTPARDGMRILTCAQEAEWARLA